MKKAKSNLYNFDEIEKKEKQKNKKRKKSKKTYKNNNTNFDIDKEIIIGLNRTDNKNINKKQNNAKKKKNIKKNKTKRNKKSNKKNNTQEFNMDIYGEDIIFEKEKKNKKHRKFNFKIIKYTFLIIGIITIIIGTMMSPLFTIKEIEVNGNEKIGKDEIISLSKISINENTYRTNMIQAKERILENPYIKTVTIKRALPNKVIITVEERKTNFMIEYGNAFVYVNNQGYILEISNEKLQVPILQGIETITENFVPGKRLEIEDLNKMSAVIKIMEIAQNNDIASLITRIDISNSKNYKIIFESEQKVAYLGDETDLNTKILSVKSILEKEAGIPGEIFVNLDLKTNYPTFRQSV